MMRLVRVTGRSLPLAATAVLVGVPLLAGPAASAQAAMPTASLAALYRAEAVDTVTFNGDCGVLGSGVGATSTPDATQVSVPAGSGVRFTNSLGQPATLRLDGEPAAEVPAGGTADVVFHDGPVAASMQISCVIGAPAGTVTVEVTEPPAGHPAEPTPAKPSQEPASPPPPSDRGGTGTGTGSPSQAGSSGGSSGSGSLGSGSSGSGSSGGSSSGSWSGPSDGQVTGEPTWAGPDQGAAAPPPAGRDGRATRSREGDRLPRWGVEVEPPNGGATSDGPATVDHASGGNELAVDQVSQTSQSTPDDGPIGLLALIATVCVVGVSAGAVRALISQRANRPEWA